MTTIEALKQRAAEKAVELVESGMVVGLGTGSTAVYAVRALGRLLANGRLAKHHRHPHLRWKRIRLWQVVHEAKG